MKITVLFSILLAPAAAGYCAEGEVKTFPSAGLESISVSAVAGPVSVSGSGKGEITVAVTGLEPEKCVITMKAEGSKLVLKAENAPKKEGEGKRGFWKRLFSGEGWDGSRYHTCRQGFTVTAPPAVKISAGSVSGEVKVSGISGEVTAKTTSGALTLEKLGAGLDAESVSGDMDLSVISGRVEADTTSGDIKLKDLSGSLKAGSVSGDMSLDGISGDVEAKSSSGGLVLARLSGSLKIESVSGDIKVNGVSGDVEAESSSGGLTLDNISGGAAARSVSGDISGTAFSNTLTASSSSGGIALKGLCGPASVSSVSGDVSLAWGKMPSSGEVRAEASSGSIRLVFPVSGGVSAALSTSSGEKTNEFSGPGFPVIVKTVSGDISVLKAK